MSMATPSSTCPRSTFIDCAAIGSIAFLLKRLAWHGHTVKLVGPRGQPKQLLELLRIHHAFEILPQQPAQTRLPLAGSLGHAGAPGNFEQVGVPA